MRNRLLVMLALALLSVGAGSASATTVASTIGRGPEPLGPIRCDSSTAWCTSEATHVPSERAWAQADADINSGCSGLVCSATQSTTAKGYRWDGYRWVNATIRVANRWFVHSVTRDGYSIMRTADTGVWVAMYAHQVRVWLPTRYAAARYQFQGCQAEPGGPSATTVMHRVCYYGIYHAQLALR